MLQENGINGIKIKLSTYHPDFHTFLHLKAFNQRKNIIRTVLGWKLILTEWIILTLGNIIKKKKKMRQKSIKINK